MNFVNIPPLHFVVRFPQLVLQRKTLSSQGLSNMQSQEQIRTQNCTRHNFCTKTAATILSVDTAAIWHIQSPGSGRKHLERRM